MVEIAGAVVFLLLTGKPSSRADQAWQKNGKAA